MLSSSIFGTKTQKTDKNFVLLLTGNNNLINVNKRDLVIIVFLFGECYIEFMANCE